MKLKKILPGQWKRELRERLARIEEKQDETLRLLRTDPAALERLAQQVQATTTQLRNSASALDAATDANQPPQDAGRKE